MADDADEAQRLIDEINSTISAINRETQRQAELINELNFLIEAVAALIPRAARMGSGIHKDLGILAEQVKKEELSAGGLLSLLKDLSSRYFTYKNLSTATKNVTQLTDEYYTKFAHYHELRRIALGYVIGLDKQIISSKTARKKVEKAYLQDTDYWLAYCIAGVMLWASDEREAAERALNKALYFDPEKGSLFFLLVCLRFARQEAAHKWYSYYLDKVDVAKLGDEWQYLLQAHLSGAFKGSRDLAEEIRRRFVNMLAQIQVTSINYDREVVARALSYARSKPHVTEFNFCMLKEYCKEYTALLQLLTSAERNTMLAEDYCRIAAEDCTPSEDLGETIEDVLYTLVESMDAQEEKVYKRIKYNELIIAAKGDIALAQRAYDERYLSSGRSSLGDLLMRWAFSDGDVRVSPPVRRFSISFLKDWIAAGFRRYAEEYRALEKDKYEISIDGWSLRCDESEGDLAVERYEEHYGKVKWKDFVKDKLVLLWGGAVAVALLIVIIMVATASNHFSSPAIVIAVLLGISGGFLLWRRILDVNAQSVQKKKVSISHIRSTLEELGEWRKAYRLADAGHEDLKQALELFSEGMVEVIGG